MGCWGGTTHSTSGRNVPKSGAERLRLGQTWDGSTLGRIDHATLIVSKYISFFIGRVCMCRWSAVCVENSVTCTRPAVCIVTAFPIGFPL